MKDTAAWTEQEMQIKKFRLERGWSQEHLAQLSGLSVRTIQRIENGNKAGLESLKCLAAVFETDINSLTQEPTMTVNEQIAHENAENQQTAYADNMKAFWLNLIAFAVVVPGLYLLNINLVPEFFFVKWVAIFWGASFILHALTIRILFGKFGGK